jgi:hypothetical protein
MSSHGVDIWVMEFYPYIYCKKKITIIHIDNKLTLMEICDILYFLKTNTKQQKI